MSKAKPIILISTEEGFDEGYQGFNFVLSRAYADAIVRSGGIPVVAMDVRTVSEYASLADGLLLTGGPVIHPARYGGIASFEELRRFSIIRDDLDFTLGKVFLAQGKPILGVGRGAMVINVLLGGTVEQRLPEMPAVSTDEVQGSLQEILGSRVTFFRQYRWGIGRLGKGLQVGAYAPGGIVDAVVYPGKSILGVVWHPERELAGIPSDDRLFQALIREARV